MGALLHMQEGNGSPAEFSTSVSVYALSSRESAKGVKESRRTVFCDGESASPPYVVYSGLAQSKLARKFIEEQGRHTPEERSASVPHLYHGQTRRRIRRLEFVPEARNECRVRIGSLSEQVVRHVPSLL